ncbi:GPI transamidase component PIG-T [Lepeophtheirus salmonis]|nr:GPI transamidase component PIG-T-like [Lepeophtheirus salmonis]XP_040575974.1 GPI transamidase component PIG-T-like [Lepeophtheirus salmonis]
MIGIFFLLCSLSVLAHLPLASSFSDEYKEELFLTPLGRNGNYIGAFFKLTTSTADASGDHYNIFPRPIGELLEEHGLREFKVTLGRGVWRSNIWGWPPSSSSPPGAVVSAWFENGKMNKKGWKGFVNALSGQLCASLNFLDEAHTLSPSYSFYPEGAYYKESTVNMSNFRMASLPGENLCTENLTPWKKLLPCQGKKGLASLLTARRVQESSFHSLGLSLKPKCADESCTKLKWELEQFANLVFDMGLQKQKDWSLRSLFGTGLHHDCPIAKTANIVWNSKEDSYSISPKNIPYESNPRGHLSFDIRSLLERGINNLQWHYTLGNIIRNEIPPPVISTRFLSGYGQEKGGIVTKVTNSLSKELPIVYLDVIPWYLRIFIHTLSITTEEGAKVEPLKIEFIPGRDRERPYILELVLNLPPHSVTSISIEFERSLLKWLEYPPDANKGFYIGSALISTLIANDMNITDYIVQFETSESPDFPQLLRLYTEVLLVSLPTPDFSMPYNVICLACTVIALAFGPLHNITTRKLVIIESKTTSKLEEIKNKLKSFFQKSTTKSE